MPAKIFKVTCYAFAGYFILMVSVMGFVVMPQAKAKAEMMCWFSVPALLALVGGWALNRFRQKARDAGIVLLVSATFEAFLIFSWVCILSEDAFKKMVQPKVITDFGDYGCGFGFLISIFVVGVALLLLGLRKPNKSTGPTPAIPTAPIGQEPFRS